MSRKVPKEKGGRWNSGSEVEKGTDLANRRPSKRGVSSIEVRVTEFLRVKQDGRVGR